MKKISFIIVLFSTLSLTAQNNQLKLDLLDILVFRTLDISYENQLNDEAAIGVSMFINFEPKNADFRYNENFQITPYFRQFLSESKGFEFFGELFGTLNFGEKDKSTTDDMGITTSDKKNYSDFALGIGGGGRHVSTNGYVFEFNVGVGRNLFNSKMSRQFVPRFGISVGKQF
ncbi:DUF3575 domain-containing protein [Wenyingzhuangia sp. 2_MG-2023]|uniref:DUF3575 domain-containing protein n=1 Tax=Wenyingzhuangia sp. 2_MG-2023 TaxID=3062639 RepID=UPI0026E2CB2B|nr:DUF3575 domain-containing protein [Wenyingzhuangia sp. 2_MG-2023]MDO6736791.1 DUF3575 domain-containing protein [Wenyingzhuangia sp. 2_MG-2023]MDO6800913.1 DUF3575 domain-containing protein [Wenyingzhuangia sp. 1_MG-2023]